MQLQIGKAIKELRTEKKVTQEALAEHLGISFQAVSKWENGSAYPDITLLPALARYFGVSLDQLFEIGGRHQAEKVEAVLEQYRKNSSEGLVDANVELLRTALAEYPTEWRLVMALATSLFARFGRTGDRSALEEVIYLCELVLRSCVDDDERFRAIQLLAYSYASIGDTEKAVSMAKRLPEVTAVSVMASVVEGDEKEYFTQLNIFSAMYNVGAHLDVLASEARLRGENERALDILNLQERVLEAFFGPHDYLWLYTLLYRMYHHRARVKMQLGDHEGAVSDLRRMAESVIAYEQLPEVTTYTVPCLDRMSLDKRTVLKNHSKSEPEMWLEAMEHRDFHPIRNTPEFMRVQEMLSEM